MCNLIRILGVAIFLWAGGAQATDVINQDKKDGRLTIRGGKFVK